MSLALVICTWHDLTLWYTSNLLSEFQNVSCSLPAPWHSLIMPSCLTGSGFLSRHFRVLPTHWNFLPVLNTIHHHCPPWSGQGSPRRFTGSRSSIVGRSCWHICRHPVEAELLTKRFQIIPGLALSMPCGPEARRIFKDV